MVKHKLKHAHKSHTFLWWAVILLSAVFLLFLIALSQNLIPGIVLELRHFSLHFFILTLIFTVIFSYRRASQRRGHHFVGPFLCSILFGVLTQFIYLIFSLFINWSDEISLQTLIQLTLFFILPSLIAFLILHYLVSKGLMESDEDESWFDWDFYLAWLEMMTNIMTVVSFIELFMINQSNILFIGIRGTIWAFYSMVASSLGSTLFEEKRLKDRVRQHTDLDEDQIFKD